MDRGQFNQILGEWRKLAIGDGAHPHEAHYLRLDCSKAKAHLNWAPKWRLEETLDKIIEWQKHYQQGADMNDITLKQIADYQMNKGDF
jgi:CDP-glucose 4,6-dehydratase